MSENLKCKKTDNYKPKLNTTEDIESVIEPITELDIKNFFKTLNEENLDKCLEELTWLSDVSKQNFKEIINDIKLDPQSEEFKNKLPKKFLKKSGKANKGCVLM